MIIGASPSQVPVNGGPIPQFDSVADLLRKIQSAIQDADAALLGVKVLPQSQGAISQAMQSHRTASLLILEALR